MIRNKFFIVVILLIIASCDQKDEIIQREIWKQNDNIILEKNYNREGTIVQSISWFGYEQDSTYNKTIKNYDTNGNLTNIETYLDNEQVKIVTTQQYDTNGYVSKTTSVEHNNVNGMSDTTIVLYQNTVEDGHLIKTTAIHNHDTSVIFYEYKDSLLINKAIYKIKDSKERLVEENRYFYKDKLLTKEVSIDTTAQYMKEIEYEYSNGKLIEEHIYENEELSESLEYKYDNSKLKLIRISDLQTDNTYNREIEYEYW